MVVFGQSFENKFCELMPQWSDLFGVGMLKTTAKVLVAKGNDYIDKTYPGLTKITKCQRCTEALDPAKSGTN